MAKEQAIKFKGTVVACMPNATFRVQIEDTETVVLATISGKIRKNNINILLDDTVDIEVAPYDITRGRIVFRYK